MILDNHTIIWEDTVKLLGVTIDKHVTFKPHIDLITKKCHGLIGVLSRASTCLSQRLLRTVYVALIRSNLEYYSAVIGMASKTQLNKLETIQNNSFSSNYWNITDGPFRTNPQTIRFGEP